MTTCKYNDSGLCYAPLGIESNSYDGECNEPLFCPYLISQMTFPNEKEKLKEQIKLLQSKLSFLEELEKTLQSKLSSLEELEKTKSPMEEAFKRVYSYYPEGCETSVWVAFQKGYEQAQEDYKIEEPIKTKSLYQFLAEWKYGIEEGDKIPQFDNDEFGVLDWSQIFIDYLYEEGDIIFENEDEIIIKFKQTQLGPNE